MSEERFVVGTNEIGEIIVTDVETDRVYRYDDPSKFFGLIRLLNEQQATIRKLQDLCGQSDGENAKLRIENKRLCDEIKLLKPTNVEQYEQIVQLQEENEQLRQQLKEKEEDEKLYANEIVELRKTNEEWLQFKDLGGDY